MNRPPQLAARRIGQTLTAFRNGPKLLFDLVASKTPFASSELVFKTRDGVVISCPNVAGARVPVYELFAEDAYRFNELAGDLPADFTALDIGGQIGCFSVALAKAFPQARINTYEASPSTAIYTRRNVTNNGLSDRVTVHNTAMSDHVGTLEFTDNGQGSGLNGLTAPEGSQTIEVECTTFAEAVKAAGGKVDLVKIDTEGAEYSIILPSDPSDWATVQSVVMEYHPLHGHSWDELKDFFTKAGLEEVRHDRVDVGLGTVWLKRKSA